MRIKKNLLLICILYILLVLFLELYLFAGYSYLSIKILPFTLSFVVIGILIIYECYTSKTFFSLNTIFNLFGILYTNYYIMQNILNNVNIPDVIYFSMNLSYISIICFNLGYNFSKKKKIFFLSNDVDSTNYNISRVVFLIFILLIISLMAEFYVIFYRIGYHNYINASRSTQALLIADYSILTFYRSTIPLISTLLLYIKLKFNHKYCLFLFGVSFLISIINAIGSVSRAELLSILLPVLFLLNYFKKISNRNVVFIGLFAFILFGAWKGLSYGKTNIVSYDSEFNTWYSICTNVLSSNFSYLYGKSYAKTLLNLIIPVTNITSLSTWYVKTYEYAVYLRGGGRGFSGVLEAYMNFGILGNVIIYYFYGFIIKQQNKKTDLQIVIYMIVMISIFQMFRSESYSLWKNMMWFKVIPIALIFMLSKRNNINNKIIE